VAPIWTQLVTYRRLSCALAGIATIIFNKNVIARVIQINVYLPSLSRSDRPSFTTFVAFFFRVFLYVFLGHFGSNSTQIAMGKPNLFDGVTPHSGAREGGRVARAKSSLVDGPSQTVGSFSLTAPLLSPRDRRRDRIACEQPAQRY
jgi:hypothetical protein